MLWRQDYQTWILADANLQLPWPDGCYLIAFHVENLRALQVWTRLLGSRLTGMVLAPQASPLASAFPPSFQPLFVDLGGWESLASTGEGPVAAICHREQVRLAMSGTPTEDAWERFESELTILADPRSRDAHWSEE